MKLSKKTDELADQIDLVVNRAEGPKTVRVGLTIHYSTTRDVWEVHYGRNKLGTFATGKTAEDALQSFVELMNTPAS